MTEAKAFRTFTRVSSLFKSERLRADIKLTLHKALIRSVMTCYPRLGICGRHPPQIAVPSKQGSPHYWTFSKAHAGTRFSHGFQPSVCIRLYNKLFRQQAEDIQNHDNECVRSIGQGEARHRKYKRLKLCGGKAYDRSGDLAAVLA
jgi:hypothetical protein